VLDVPKDQSKSKNESWGESRDDDDSNNDDNDDGIDDDSKNVKSDDDHEQADDKRKESDDEEKETQDDEINEELYCYVNINLTNDEPTNKEKDDQEITCVGHANVNQEGAEYGRINEELYGYVNINLTNDEPTNKEKDDQEITCVGHANVNQEGAVELEVVSMVDVNVQHEVPRTSPLLTIPVSVIPEHIIASLPK
nr:hypothetical protein [Tanacetum cinerariifolium]